MKKRRYLYQFIAVMAFVVFSLPSPSKANVTKVDQSNDADGEKRADIININTLKSFGELERKEVPFLHDAHTEALKKDNKGCETCHLTDKASGKGNLSPKFKRLADTNKKQVMEIYHTNCMACHKEMSDAGEKTGPVEVCGDCHNKEPEVISSRQPLVFDKYLHFYHMEINDEGCSVCHHGTKKEGSCRYCHKDKDGNLISMESASHLTCIKCHRESSGPVKCSGCHDINEQKKFEKPDEVQRLEVGQPDFALIGAKSPDENIDNKEKLSARMNPVPFDHKSHEQYQDSCRICHHAEIGSCTKSCHTITGSEKGKMINSEQAMHKLDSDRSCLGCHEKNKGQPKCAGCHGSMQIGSHEQDACLKCHVEPPKAGTGENLTTESKAALLLESRKNVQDSFNDKDIPEEVTIDVLSSQYGPVVLPHRQIIDALAGDIKNSTLAGYFHSGEGTLCMGCHHNSPPSRTPPRCESCHSKSFDESIPLKPELKVAFHRQCMGCHDRMGIKVPKSTSCEDCHKVIGKNKLL